MAGWATISVMLIGLLILLPRRHMYTTSYHIFTFTYDGDRDDAQQPQQVYLRPRTRCTHIRGILLADRA